MTPKPDANLLQEINSLLTAQPDIDEFEVLATNLSGLFFGKRYPIDALQSFASNGLAMPMSMFVLSTLGEPLPGMHFGIDDGDPDALFRLIPGSVSIVNWGNKPRLQVLATAFEGDKPVYFEPRNVLAKVLDAYQQKNWQPMVAFELEFYLFDKTRDDDNLIQIVRNPKTGQPDTATVLSTTRLADFEAVIDEIVNSCQQQNIETGAISAEMGAGQFEINFNHHSNVLRAADEACLFKRTVIEVAKNHDMAASFIAKPMLDQPGNGLHMHVSVVDQNGDNIFSAGDKPQPVLSQAIGGLIDCMPAAMSFWAPNINSFRRYTGGTNCAPVSLTWGNENRTVAFRIPIAKNAAWRVENRVPGADANPYLAMAVTLAAMLYGVNQQLDPGQACEEAVSERDQKLPLSLPTALASTLGNSALIDILGREFVELYCRHREAETFAFEQNISAREYDWYL